MPELDYFSLPKKSKVTYYSLKRSCFLLALALNVAALSYSQESTQLDSLYERSSGALNKYQYKEAIESGLTLLELSKNYENVYFQYQAHNILGMVCDDLNDTIRQKKHHEVALEYALKLENDSLSLISYNSLGNIYSEDKRTTQKGINYYKKAIELGNKLGLPEQTFAPTVNIAWTHIDNKEFRQAEPYLKEFWKMYGDRDDNYAGSQLNNLTGRYYMGIGELEKARPYFEKAVQMVEEDSLILQASDVYKEYAQLLFAEENYREAFLALEKYQDYKSRIFEQDRLKSIEAANIQFDVSQYQQDLELAKNEQLLKDEIIENSREKMVVLVISAIGLLIILLALFRITLSRRRLIKEMSNKNKELLEAKEEAERLTILKTKFFSTISHEIRTPLYGVIGLTSILMEDKSLEKHEDDLKSLKFSADYLLALINDVLQMNKMESNLLKLEELPFNLKDLLGSIVKSFEFTRLQNKNNIHLKIDENINYNLIGDPVRLSQVLMNLVGNAMKFTERGNIWITAKLAEDISETVKVNFEVQDDGLGIPRGKQQEIFEEFSQLKSANYNYQGTGLGLPIVKKLLNLFHSEIRLESEEGMGSNFTFEIEFKKAAPVTLPEMKNSPGEIAALAEAGGAGRKILIVDDNRINQVVTRRILEQKFFDCDICDNGTGAVEMIKNNKYDLVLMDLNMPGISGLEATKLIRRFDQNLPIIALTAVEIEEVRQEIQEVGMNDIIVKPYDTSTFYQVIYRNIPAEVVNH